MLENFSKKNYGNLYDTAVLEQWKTCVEMANSNTEKRNNANNLFITINAALFAVVTFAGDYKSILLSSVGIIVSILWLNSIRSYKQLSQVKYDIINTVEKKLPLAPFSAEWEKLNYEHNYVGLTKIERFLPWLFLSLYAVAILFPIIKFLIILVCPCAGGVAQ